MNERREPANTEIEYMYRDASNYKIYFTEVVSGRVPADFVGPLSDLFGSVLSGDPDIFFPENVGLPASTFASMGYEAYDDDPDWHELVCLHYTNRPPTVPMTAEDLVSALKSDGAFGSV